MDLDLVWFELPFVINRRVVGDVLEDRLPAEFSTGVGSDYQHVRLHFLDAVFAKVILHVGLLVIAVILFIKFGTAASFEIVDPGQSVFFDEVGIQAEAVDDQVVGTPADASTPANRSFSKKGGERRGSAADGITAIR